MCDADDRTVEVGQKLTYTVTGKVPSAKGYDGVYSIRLPDTMTAGLTYQQGRHESPSAARM